MASLSRDKIAALKQRLCELDAKYASLLRQQYLGFSVKDHIEKVEAEIQKINEQVSACEAALLSEGASSRAAAPRPQADRKSVV